MTSILTSPSPDQFSALKTAILALMSEASERCYCAGWMSGTARAHWRAFHEHEGPDYPWGMFAINKEAGTLCEAIGWWPSDDGPEIDWITAEEARDRYASLPTEGEAR